MRRRSFELAIAPRRFVMLFGRWSCSVVKATGCASVVRPVPNPDLTYSLAAQRLHPPPTQLLAVAWNVVNVLLF